MKTLLKQFSGLLLFVACLAAAPSLKAQIANPYEFGNSSNCTIKIVYQFYYNPGSGCAVCPGGGGSMNISPGTAVNVPSPCNPICDVVVTVVAIDGVVLTPTQQITVSFNTQTGSNTCGNCNCTSYTMNWTNINTKFF